MHSTSAKQSYLPHNNVKHIDYKDVELLKKFLNPHGRIIGARRTGISAKDQRKLSAAVKYARFMGLLAYTSR